MVHHQIRVFRPHIVRTISKPLFRTLLTSSEPDPHSKKSELKAAKETQDVRVMDQLLKAIRTRSNPAFTNIIPMRRPVLWSETLLNTANASQLHQSSAPAASEALHPRYMHDSYTEFLLPFGSSPQLLEQYTNASGGIRIGMILEHLDSIAGSISYKHMLGPGVDTLGRIQDRGFYLVTASVDRLDMLSPLNPTYDLRLSGQVIYTGRSSMEVAVKVESVSKDEVEETVLLGRFSMVCRSALTHRAHNVNPLVVTTTEERALYSMGEALKDRRQSIALRSLSLAPPSSTEAQSLHAFFLKYGQNEGKQLVSSVDLERVWMGDTRLEKCMLMFPQERNVHQKIFGGYLMRLAYELGFASSTLFTGKPMAFLSLDGISFARPVPIGSILKLESHILHSSSTAEFPVLVHVGVKANVVDVKTGLEQTTNNFRFTWCRRDGDPLSRMVVPKTYKEAMLFLEGKRALDIGAEIRGLRLTTDP